MSKGVEPLPPAFRGSTVVVLLRRGKEPAPGLQSSTEIRRVWLAARQLCQMLSEMLTA